MANNQRNSVLKPRKLARKKEGNFKPSVTAAAPEVETQEEPTVSTTNPSVETRETNSAVLEGNSTVSTEQQTVAEKPAQKKVAEKKVTQPIQSSTVQIPANNTELTAEEKKAKRYKYQEKQIKISNDIKKKINVVKDLHDFSNDYEVVELLLDLYYQKDLDAEDRFLFDRIDRASK